MITSNADKIIKDINKFVKTKSKDVGEALIETGLRGVAIAKLNTPVKDGRLRNSMTYTTTEKTNSIGIDNVRRTNEKDVVYIGTNVVYAAKVEFIGRSKGYLLRSYKILVPTAKKIFKDILRKGLK
jgi:hypothetical protein